MVLDEIISFNSQTKLKHYSKIPRNCFYSHEIQYDDLKGKFEDYQKQIKSIPIKEVLKDSYPSSEVEYKLFISCFLEKDQCSSDFEFIPVVVVIPKTFYDENYLENQPNHFQFLIFDR